VAVGHERVARVLAFEHRREFESLGQFHWNVLERVHRQVRSPLLECGLELLDEQSLAADLGQRPVENLVAACRHAQQLDGQAESCAQ